MAVLDVNLRVEGSTTQSSCNYVSTMRAGQAITVSILLVVDVGVKINTRQGAKQQKVNYKNQVTNNQDNEHRHVQPLRVVMITAIVGVAEPEDIADDQPNNQKTIHNHKKCPRKIQSILIIVPQHWNFEQIQETFRQPDNEECHDPFAYRDAALVLPFSGEYQYKQYNRQNHNIYIELYFNPFDLFFDFSFHQLFVSALVSIGLN